MVLAGWVSQLQTTDNSRWTYLSTFDKFNACTNEGQLILDSKKAEAKQLIEPNIGRLIHKKRILLEIYRTSSLIGLDAFLTELIREEREAHHAVGGA